MSEFNLEEFSPKKAELTALIDKHKELTIKGPDDKEGYNQVVTARKELKAARREIERFSEAYRKKMLDEYNAKRQEVLKITEDHVGIISPREDELKAMQDNMDEQIAKMERQALLPERKERLKEIGLEISDDEILGMSPEEFTTFFNKKKGEYLEEKERKIAEQEAEVARQKEIEDAKKEARLRVEKEAEQEKWNLKINRLKTIGMEADDASGIYKKGEMEISKDEILDDEKFEQIISKFEAKIKDEQEIERKKAEERAEEEKQKP